MKAVIDIGTNSVLLLLAQRSEGGDVDVTFDLARVTRLGQGAAASGRLSDAAIERTIAVLTEYRALAEQHGATLIPVATESLRMAANRDVFLREAHAALGSEVRMISGDEEAELSYRSVASEEPSGPLRVLDIGGGSTELVVGEGDRVVSRCSHRVGSVRLTEAFVHDDPPTPQSIAAMAAAARSAFEAQPLDAFPVLHGLAGTVTTAAALLLGLQTYDRAQVDRTRFSRAQIEALRDALAAEPLAVRSQRPCLPQGRADVVVAGVTILLAALDHCGAHTLVVRDRGLRYALV